MAHWTAHLCPETPQPFPATCSKLGCLEAHKLPLHVQNQDVWPWSNSKVGWGNKYSLSSLWESGTGLMGFSYHSSPWRQLWLWLWEYNLPELLKEFFESVGGKGITYIVPNQLVLNLLKTWTSRAGNGPQLVFGYHLSKESHTKFSTEKERPGTRNPLHVSCECQPLMLKTESWK